jgi:hypothetical protein
MNSSAEAIATGIDHVVRVMMMYTEDLKGSEWTHRACPNANCAAWTLGHLIVSARSFMTKAGATDVPSLPDGFEKRFGRADDAPKATDFGDTSILRPMFKEWHERLAAYTRTLSPQKLATSLGSDHPIFKTVGTMLAFVPVHAATHAGQISIIRRTLGRPPLV